MLSEKGEKNNIQMDENEEMMALPGNNKFSDNQDNMESNTIMQ